VAAEEGPGPSSGRSVRIGALVEELIAALRSGDGSGASVTMDGGDAALLRLERDLVRLDVLEEVGRSDEAVTLGEMRIVSAWPYAVERHQWCDRYDRMTGLIDDMHEGAVITSLDGRIEYLNRLAASELHEFTGFPPDQLVGRTIAELGIPEEHDIARNRDRLVAMARHRATVETSFLGRWKEIKYRAIYSQSGDVEAMAFLYHDIHEPRLAQIRLVVLSKLSATVGSPDAAKMAETLAGLPVPELADWCVVNMVENRRITSTSIAQSDPAKKPLRDAAMRAVPDWDKHPLWMEMRLTTGFQLLTDVSDELLRRLAFTEEQHRLLKQAGVRSIMVQPVVSRGEIAAIFTFMYTTESGRRYGADEPALTSELALHAAHLIEDARLLGDLRTTEARFRVSLAGAKTVVFEQDPSLRYRWYYNPLIPFSLVGMTHEEAFPPEDAALLDGLKRRVLETGERSSQELMISLGGERRNYRHVMEARRDPAGTIVGIIGSATDITEEKRTQQQLTEALRFRDGMMGVLGHDLRNPLSAVTTAAAAVFRRDVADDVRSKIKVIESAAGRMGEMIETLLDLTRVESLGQLPVSRVSADLGALARQVVDESNVVWPDRAIHLATQGNLAGTWDPARVEQALSNLIANAMQYGDRSVPVRVTVDGTGEAVVLQVMNEGRPIPEDLVPVLFEPFSRGCTQTSPQGLGLGLFIVKQIASAHGGTIDVASRADSGTVFTLRLPRRG
jgi:PAS domain S-box-containing protein